MKDQTPDLRTSMDYSLTYLHGKRDKLQAFFAAYILPHEYSGHPTQEVTAVIPPKATEEQSARIKEAMWEISKVLHELFHEP